MRVIGRILGVIVGGGLGVAGFFLWMISNDLDGEAVTKLIAGALIVAGIAVLVVSLLPWDSKRVPGADNSRPI